MAPFCQTGPVQAACMHALWLWKKGNKKNRQFAGTLPCSASFSFKERLKLMLGRKVHWQIVLFRGQNDTQLQHLMPFMKQHASSAIIRFYTLMRWIKLQGGEMNSTRIKVKVSLRENNALWLKLCRPKPTVKDVLTEAGKWSTARPHTWYSYMVQEISTCWTADPTSPPWLMVRNDRRGIPTSVSGLHVARAVQRTLKGNCGFTWDYVPQN